MTALKLIQIFLLALFAFLVLLLLLPHIVSPAHAESGHVKCWATLCEWKGDDAPIKPKPVKSVPIKGAKEQQEISADEERAAGMEALRAAFASVNSAARLGPAVLHLSRPWEAERMPIAVRYEPIYDARILPPKEFDHDYNGTIFLSRVDDLEIKRRCRQSGSKTACTYPPQKPGDACFLWIVYDDILNYQRISYDAAFRHERAHCNGWRHDSQGNTIR
jgi:hypothetical protein